MVSFYCIQIIDRYMYITSLPILISDQEVPATPMPYPGSQKNYEYYRTPGQILSLRSSLAFVRSLLYLLACVGVFSSPEHKVLMVSYCGQWLSIVRRRATCVVRRPSTFDVYTLETTFVDWFWWNLIRMFVLTISRLSSNMGHVGSKTRSPGQILGNSCLHSRDHICDLILMKLDQNVCFNNI